MRMRKFHDEWRISITHPGSICKLQSLTRRHSKCKMFSVRVEQQNGPSLLPVADQQSHLQPAASRRPVFHYIRLNSMTIMKEFTTAGSWIDVRSRFLPNIQISPGLMFVSSLYFDISSTFASNLQSAHLHSNFPDRILHLFLIYLSHPPPFVLLLGRLRKENTLVTAEHKE